MASEQKTIRLFLASSAELKNERDEFEKLIRRRNKSWKKRGVYLELEIWEDTLEAMSQTRSQDEYNKFIKQCDIFVMLFFSKVGKYSEEEFDVAYELFKETDKPLIFTYFKNAELLSGTINETDTASLLAFKKKLQNLEHFHSEYKNIDDLKFQFSDQLDKIYDDIISEGAEVDEIPGQTDQLFINIIHDGKSHRSRVTRGSDGSPLVDQLIHLSKSDEIEIKGRKYPLGEIIEALYSKTAQERQIFFDENAQIEIGRYLFDEIFGPLSSAEKTTMFSAQGGTIYIACDSVWILTLPWLFLSDSEGLLFMRNWSISFTHPRFADQQPEDVESGSRHRVLIIAPDAEGQPMTHSEQHLEKLKTMLSSQADWLTESARYLRVVKTWDEFVTALDELKPNIVYYYGNANGEGLGTELVFADENNNPHGINLTEFSNHVKTKSSSVELLYLNCCQGNVHGFSAIGNLLRGAVPALLTNRPYASVQTAGDLAVEILLRILFHNMPPHVTLRSVAWNLQSEDLARRSSPGWANLSLFRNYRAWHSFSVGRKSSRIPDPIWHVKIDRRNQFNMVSGNVRLMLREQRPKSYVVYLVRAPGSGSGGIPPAFEQRTTGRPQ